MGLFNFLGKKKEKREVAELPAELWQLQFMIDMLDSKKGLNPQETAKLRELRTMMNIAIEYQDEVRKIREEEGVDTDDIPKGYGPFGLCATNPIPTRDVSGSNEYLSRLRTKDGRPVEVSPIKCSTSAKDVTSGMIDMYHISSGGVDLGWVYLCRYHKKNSEKAPEGFHLV